VQIRITPTEKKMIERLKDMDSDMTVSKLFRDSLHKYCQVNNITVDIKDKGIGGFTIG
jgi:hypothetical protein